MQSKEKYQILIESTEFKDWFKENSDSYLAHIFRLFDEANKDIWQFGFYNKDDTITTFILEKDSIKKVPEEAIFKKDEHKLTKLNLETVKISFEDAVGTAKELHEKKHSQHLIMKTIAILQSLKEGQVYNITFVTQSMHTLNLHIDSESGKVVHEKLTSLMDIAKFEKGKGGKQDYIG